EPPRLRLPHQLQQHGDLHRAGRVHRRGVPDAEAQAGRQVHQRDGHLGRRLARDACAQCRLQPLERFLPIGGSRLRLPRARRRGRRLYVPGRARAGPGHGDGGYQDRLPHRSAALPLRVRWAPAAHDGGYEAAAASRRMLLAPGEGERNRTGEGRKWRVGRGAGRPVTSESSSGTTWSGWSARSAWACTTSRSATAATAAASRTPTSTRSVWSSTGAARPADPSASRARSVRRAGGGAGDRALAPAPAPARVAYLQAPGTTSTAGDARSAALPVQQITL